MIKKQKYDFKIYFYNFSFNFQLLRKFVELISLFGSLFALMTIKDIKRVLQKRKMWRSPWRRGKAELITNILYLKSIFL